MKRLSLIFVILGSIFSTAGAQDTDPLSHNAFITPSPQAAEMAQHGKFAPSLYTGTFRYSRPLYTYKDPDFEIPVSLEYSFCGYRPSQSSGPVGLGWTLSCGGVITREVVGLPDEYNSDDVHGFYFLTRNTGPHYAVLKNRLIDETYLPTDGSSLYYSCQNTPYISETNATQFFFGSDILRSSAPINTWNSTGIVYENLFDNASDIYHFSLPSCSGDFIIKPSGEVAVYNCNSPPGEIEVSLNLNYSSEYSRITIKTSDGYTYLFGGDIDYIDYSYESAHGDSSDIPRHFSAIKLKKITAPNGRTIEFCFSGDGLLGGHPFLSVSYSPELRLIQAQNEIAPFYYNGYPKADAKVMKTISRLPQRILVDGAEIVRFNYSDRSAQEFSTTAYSPVFYGCRRDVGYSNHAFDTANRLSSVTIKDTSGNILDNISLSHSYSSNEIGYSPKMFLTSITGNDGVFSFEYVHSSSDDRYPPIDCDETDHWGFWRYNNGKFTFLTSSHINSQEESLYNVINNNKNPYYNYTIYGALTKINYPAGGSSEIEYEQNVAHRRLDVNLTSQSKQFFIDSCGAFPVGGARVRKITNHSNVSSFQDSTVYSYETSGLLLHMPRYIAALRARYQYTNWSYLPSATLNSYRYSITFSNAGLTYSQSNDFIGYSKVKTIFSDGSSKVTRFFDYHDYPDTYLVGTTNDTFNKYFLTQNTSDPDNENEVVGVFSYIDGDNMHRDDAITNTVLDNMSLLRGKVKEECTFSAEGNAVLKEEYEYTAEEMFHAVQLVNCYSHGSSGTIYCRQALLENKQSTEYFEGEPVSVNIAYTYNSKGQVTSETTSSQAAPDVYKRFYSYCYETDAAAPAGNIAAVATTRSTGNGQDWITSLTGFSYDYSKPTLPSLKREYNINIPYQTSSVFTPQTGAPYRQTLYSYNTLWRPLRISLPGSAYQQYTWDTSGRYTTALEENGPDNVTEYEWKDMVGISHKYLPTHLHEYYTYDSRGRLHTTSNSPTDSLSAYSYHLYSDDNEGDASYIRKKVFPYPGITATDITYYDGLGYPATDVQVGAGSEGNVVTPYELDAMRRLDARAYLPYPSTSSDYDAGAVAAQQAWYQNRFGTGQTRNYSETIYEAYPDGRPVSRRLPGAEYAAHPDTIAYRLNTSGDSILDISYVYGETPAFRTAASHIPAGSLKCTETTDADGRTSMTFTNPFGLPVLERRVDGNSRVDTYFVHDLKDSLVCVIQPEGSAMLALNTTYSYDLSSPLAERHCFLRQYDGRGRVIRSRQPGSGWEDYAYDERGRVVFSRDAVMAGSGRWIYSEYDCYDRLTARYLIQSSASLTQIRSIAAFSIDTMQEDVLGNIGATVTALLESHSYDDTGYDATNPAPVPSYLAFSPVASNVQGVADIAPALRLSTSRFRQYYEKLLILPSDGNYTNPQYVERAIYYDNMGRVLQTVEKNAQGGTTRSSWNYDMAGNVISSHESITMGSASKTVLKACEQDSRGRIINERTYIDGASTPTTSVQYSYDVLGRRNAISSGGLIQADHYALQGWSVQRRAELNSAILFDEYMHRDDAFYGTPSHTGAIAEVFWMWNNQPAGTYEYSYDNLGRLTDSRIWMYGQPNSYFSERDIAYDLNGNITALKRYGSSSAAASDDLSYTYDGNRISSVNGQTYGHDANGNVTIDSSHETQTSYNLLNLPRRVEDLQSGDGLNYTYLADGTKAAMTDDDGTGYAYAGDMVFARSPQGTYSFESVAYGNGRIEGASNTVRRYVTDHLGNVRAIVTGDNVVERNDYYPFGGRHPRSTLPVLSSNRWRLGAKESQPSLTGSLVDFGARMYDPHTGRWTTQDPMAWKYLGLSPYNYCGNNPVNLVDPDGMDTKIVVSNHRIKYQAVIYIYGEDASKKLARSIGRKINDAWQNTNPTIIEDREVKFNVKVRRLKKSTEFIPPNQYSNIMEISSERGGVIDSNHGRFSYDSCVHEFGHMIGLKDRYHNVTVDGSTYSEPDVGYEGTIMAEPSCMGTVTQDDVIKSFRLVLPGQISNGVYFIDKHNNEKSN